MKTKLSLIYTALVLSSFNCKTVIADQFFSDDVIVVGSICVGQDCNNGESFGFDTIRLKENNLRIKFQDTSNSASFPTVDWQITANESTNGGQNKFSIDDVDAGRTPFTIEASAPSHSLYVDDGGRIGVGTSTPVVELHIVNGDSPTLRLEQDGSSGFTAQTWDVAGNETNFFVRDASNGSKLPFRIQTNAPSNSLYIANDGDIGLETTSPDGLLDIAHPSDANDHAVLVSSTGNFGINIANGFQPTQLFDIQDNSGESFFTVNNVGAIDHKSTYLDSNSSLCTNNGITCGRFSPVMTIEENNSNTTGRMLLNLKNNAPGWLGFENTTANTQWFIANAPDRMNFVFVDLNNSGITVPLSLLNNGDVQMAGTLYANSSVYLKENINKVETANILERLNTLDIYTWNYKDNIEDTPHMGPMAQDFFKTFGLGKNDKLVSNLDLNGVSLAAIKALYKRVLELEKLLETKK